MLDESLRHSSASPRTYALAGPWTVATMLVAGLIAFLGEVRVLPLAPALILAAFVAAVSAWWGLYQMRRLQRGANAEYDLNTERLRSTIDNAPIGLAMVGLDGRWLRVNNAICQIVGYPADTLMGMTFQDITHPEDLATDIGLVQQTIRGEIPGYTMEKRYFHRDGHIVPVELHVSMVRTPDGHPLHFISQIVDLTQRVAAERALRREESAFSALVEETDDLVIRYAPDRAIVYANPATARGSGFDSHTLVGRRMEETGLPADVADRWDAALARVIESGMSEKFEYAAWQLNGAQREWQVRFTAERDASGQTSGAFAVSRDITELQHANEAVRRREHEFVALAENAEDMIVRYDLAGRYRYANPAALAFVGHTFGEVLGRRPAEVAEIPIEIVEAWAERNARAIRERKTVKLTVTIETPEGPRTYESSATPELDALGRPIAVLVVGRDVTDRRALELENARLQKALSEHHGA